MSLRDPFRLVGSTIGGKYRVDRVVGEGGLGVVYAGHHLLLDAKIAIKCLKPLGGSPEDEARLTELFLREARVLFSLTHPSIVRLFDVGALTDPVLPYVVLELIEGPTLDDEITRRAQAGAHFTVPELLAIFEPVLEAVAFAHQNGVVHRDLKPSNVMLVRSATGAVSAKVVDFGIARRLGGQKSTVGLSGFTPRYAAPEQWDGTLGGTSSSTDVFALGLMIAEALQLRPVFAGGPAQIFAQAMDTTRRVAVTPQRRDVPVAIDAILDRCTRITPAERYPSARDLLQAVRDVLRPLSHGELPVTPAASSGGGIPSSSVRQDVFAPTLPVTPATPPRVDTLPGPTAPQSPPSRTPVLLALLTAGLAVLALLGTAVFLMLDRRNDPAPPPAGQEATEDKGKDKGKEKASSGPAKAKVAKKNLGKFSATLESVMDEDLEIPDKATTDVFKAHLEQVKACFGEALERDPQNDGGKIMLHVEVDEKGKVSAMCAEDDMNDKALCFCLCSEAATWKLARKGWSYFVSFRFKHER